VSCYYDTYSLWVGETYVLNQSGTVYVLKVSTKDLLSVTGLSLSFARDLRVLLTSHKLSSNKFMLYLIKGVYRLNWRDYHAILQSTLDYL